MKSEALIDVLEGQIARLKKLKGEEVGGFSIVQAPEGEPMVALFMESTPAPASFYKYLADKLHDALKAVEKHEPFIGIRGGR